VKQCACRATSKYAPHAHPCAENREMRVSGKFASGVGDPSIFRANDPGPVESRPLFRLPLSASGAFRSKRPSGTSCGPKTGKSGSAGAFPVKFAGVDHKKWQPSRQSDPPATLGKIYFSRLAQNRAGFSAAKFVFAPGKRPGV